MKEILFIDFEKVKKHSDKVSGEDSDRGCWRIGMKQSEQCFLCYLQL